MDTCDECGPAVSAKFNVHLPSGLTLAYCGHHYTTHIDKLVELGAYVYRTNQ